MKFYVYILTNKFNNVLYIWVTNSLYRRITEHKQWIIEWFTKKYNCKKLIYVEMFNNIKDAIKREKQLKNWHRDRKFSLIKNKNPNLEELEI